MWSFSGTLGNMRRMIPFRKISKWNRWPHKFLRMSLVLKSVLPHKNVWTSFWEYTLTLLHIKMVDHLQLSTCCSSSGQTWKFSCRRNVTLRRRKTCRCLTQRDCGGKAERGSKGELREKTWLGWTLRPTLVRGHPINSVGASSWTTLLPGPKCNM